MWLRSHRDARRVIVASLAVCLAACLATVSPGTGVHGPSDGGDEHVAVDGATTVADAGADDAKALAEDVGNAEDVADAEDAEDAGVVDICLDASDAASLTVSVETLTTSVSPCPAAYAHPNVCCWNPPVGTARPLCFEYEGLPFQECGCGALTFPDPRACCPLDGGGACIATPVPNGDAAQEAGDAATPGSAGAGLCYFPCGPGSYVPRADSGLGTLCSELPQDTDGGSSCFYCCGGNGCIGNVCGCAPTAPDAQPCQCGPQCNACPDGWQTAAGFPDLCCRSGAGDAAQCFSQANQILPAQ